MRPVTGWFVIILACSNALADERLIDFSQFPLDKTPPGFRSALSGGGKLGDWKVILDRTGSAQVPGSTNATTGPKVLAQLSQDGTDERFPMLVFDQESYGDFALTTRF